MMPMPRGSRGRRTTATVVKYAKPVGPKQRKVNATFKRKQNRKTFGVGASYASAKRTGASAVQRVQAVTRFGQSSKFGNRKKGSSTRNALAVKVRLNRKKNRAFGSAGAKSAYKNF
jgi:hypothetical protein